jgi:hypothetical protein
MRIPSRKGCPVGYQTTDHSRAEWQQIPTSFFAPSALSFLAVNEWNRGIIYVHGNQRSFMIELIANTELVEGVLEEIGNKTESWKDRWWWKPLSWFTLISPFLAVGVYYYWFL